MKIYIIFYCILQIFALLSIFVLAFMDKIDNKKFAGSLVGFFLSLPLIIYILLDVFK